MQEVLSNPALQSGAVPFVAALIVSSLLARLGWYWAGLGLVAGFYAAAYFVPGLEFTPLTSTRKILVLGLAAAVLGAVLDLMPKGRTFFHAAIFVSAVAGLVWMLWPVLTRSADLVPWLAVAGGCLYAGWLAAAMEDLRNRPIAATSAALALGLGTGACALFGASAMLGQIGFALAAAAGAVWLVVVMMRKVEVGSVFALPAGVLAGLIGAGALVYAKLPWYSLPLLALVPLLARVPVPKGAPRFVQGVIFVVMCGIAAGGAGVIAWRVAGAPPL